MTALKLDRFTRAYIEAALWSSNDESDESGGLPLDENYDADDIAPEALAQIVDECRAFQDDNAADLALAYDLYPRREWAPEEQAGHDFWLTRCGHGAGFWDREIGEVGERLTEASHKARERMLYVGDDGRLYYCHG
jgi:hypothetical protein